MNKSSVIAIVFNQNKDRIVALKRRDVPIWVFPGGGVESNETPKEAAIREVKEETGLSVKIVKTVGEYTPKNKLSNYTHVFECEIVDGDLSTGDETREINFFEVKKLPHPFLHVHNYWLDDALLNLPDIIRKEISGTSYFHFAMYLITHPVLMFRYILTLIGLTFNSK